LAKTVLEEQIAMGWPGVAQKVAAICETVGLPCTCIEDVDKMEVVEAIMFHHIKALKEEMKVKALRN
jgi:hypothetical protein